MELLKNNIDLLIEVVYPASEGYGKIAASSESKLSEPAISNWQDFVSTVKRAAAVRGYKVIEEHPSPNNTDIPKSYYLTFVHEDDIDGNTYNVVVCARVSNHALTDDQIAKQDRYREHVLIPEIEERDGVRIKNWIPKSVTVNGETFPTYEEALLYVIDCLDSWENDRDVLNPSN